MSKGPSHLNLDVYMPMGFATKVALSDLEWAEDHTQERTATISNFMFMCSKFLIHIWLYQILDGRRLIPKKGVRQRGRDEREVYVSNLPFSATEEDVKMLFSKIGYKCVARVQVCVLNVAGVSIYVYVHVFVLP